MTILWAASVMCGVKLRICRHKCGYSWGCIDVAYGFTRNAQEDAVIHLEHSLGSVRWTFLSTSLQACFVSELADSTKIAIFPGTPLTKGPYLRLMYLDWRVSKSRRTTLVRQITLPLSVAVLAFTSFAYADDWSKTYELGGKPELRVEAHDANVVLKPRIRTR